VRRAAHGGGAGDSLKRWLAAGSVLLLAVTAITLALFGSLSHTSRHDVQFDAGAPVVASRSKPRRSGRRQGAAPAKLTPTGNRPPVSAAEVRLQSAMTKAMRLAGPSSGALVYDLGARSELFALRPSVKRPPASVEKLWTTTALMTKLGPNVRLHTAVLGTGSLRDGVWHGNLYLRGGGDPTFGDPTFNRDWELGYGPTANQLVAQLARRGIRRVTGSVFGDESLFDRHRGGLMTAYAVDVPDFGGQLSALTYDHGATAVHFSPATFAANELVLTMRGSDIKARASKHARTTPHRVHLLAIVASPPMSVMARLMDVPSDDLFAELFTKQLGVLFGRGGTISAGAHVIAETIAAAFDLHPTVLDGSGLSRNDRSSPLEIVDLLADIWQTPVGRELVAALPTVGVNGTVRSIGLKTAAQGNCLAKTGTLDNVTNLAGYCSSHGHHALAFALFVDGPENAAALLLESRMIAAIARY
jgi:D-alanyl-D-alanine carboxypeptidase/D-alanyl-D-alanine-endopeptidase (penicillin-binding protein 4)